MIGQILNFGLPSPIDVQVTGFNVDANREFANNLLQKLRSIPGAVDLHIHQSGDYPQFNVDVDRSKAQLVGLTEQAVATNMLVSLSGSFQTAPSFWVDPKSGTQYQVATQTPQFRLENLNDLGNTPLRRVGACGFLANTVELGECSPRGRAGGGDPLQRHTGHRYLRLGARHRFRLCRRK
jgi:multidrug efflux pump subunit AcrB